MSNISTYKPHKYPGFLVQIEGTDGCGKSTHLNLFTERLLRELPGIPVFKTEVPGGTPEMEELKELLLHGELTDEKRAEILLKNHGVLIDEVLIPRLEEGFCVTMSRPVWSYPSYQGFALDLGVSETIAQIKPLVEKLQPDVILRLVVGPTVAHLRMDGRSTKNGVKRDSFEARKLDFYDRVLMGYEYTKESLKALMPNTKLIEIIDLEGELSQEDVQRRVWDELFPLVQKWFEDREGKVAKEYESSRIGRER